MTIIYICKITLLSRGSFRRYQGKRFERTWKANMGKYFLREDLIIEK